VFEEDPKGALELLPPPNPLPPPKPPPPKADPVDPPLPKAAPEELPLPNPAPPDELPKANPDPEELVNEGADEAPKPDPDEAPNGNEDPGVLVPKADPVELPPPKEDPVFAPKTDPPEPKELVLEPLNTDDPELPKPLLAEEFAAKLNPELEEKDPVDCFASPKLGKLGLEEPDPPNPPMLELVCPAPPKAEVLLFPPNWDPTELPPNPLVEVPGVEPKVGKGELEEFVEADDVKEGVGLVDPKANPLLLLLLVAGLLGKPNTLLLESV
jgi:hypothetical protein